VLLVEKYFEDFALSREGDHGHGDADKADVKHILGPARTHPSCYKSSVQGTISALNNGATLIEPAT